MAEKKELNLNEILKACLSSVNLLTKNMDYVPFSIYLQQSSVSFAYGVDQTVYSNYMQPAYLLKWFYKQPFVSLASMVKSVFKYCLNNISGFLRCFLPAPAWPCFISYRKLNLISQKHPILLFICTLPLCELSKYLEIT